MGNSGTLCTISAHGRSYSSAGRIACRGSSLTLPFQFGTHTAGKSLILPQNFELPSGAKLFRTALATAHN